MKRVMLPALFLMPVMAFAQNGQPVDQQQMQQMMAQMQEMQKCMQQVDQSRMEELGKRADEMDAKVKALCAEGKRDEAQETAMAFGEEMMSDPDMTIMRKCAENAPAMVQGMPQAEDPEELSKRHVCDE